MAYRSGSRSRAVAMVRVVCVLSLLAGGHACNIFNRLGDSGGNDSPTSICTAGVGGAGGDGDGGAWGGGGGDVGTGTDGTGVGVGAGGSNVGSAGAGGGDGNARHAPRHRPYRPVLQPEGDTVLLCENPCAPECVGVPLGTPVGAITPDTFPFVTTMLDDGTDVAGGWQVTAVALFFKRWVNLVPESWSCPLTVGMPLRTAKYGIITPAAAASLTSQITNTALNQIAGPPFLPPGIFCTKLTATVKALFASPVWAGFGARVN
jgi:hypothetical protein